MREDVGELVEVSHRVDLRAELATTGDRQRRRLRHAALEPFAIDEVELVLQRDDRREVQAMEAIEHARQHMARVGEEGSTVGLVHRDLDLGDAVALPRHGDERTGQGLAGTIGVALVEPKTARLDGAALDIEREHRTRQRHALGVKSWQRLPLDPLAALDAVEVVQEDVDVPRVGMACEELLELGESAHGGSSVSPDTTPGEAPEHTGRLMTPQYRFNKNIDLHRNSRRLDGYTGAVCGLIPVRSGFIPAPHPACPCALSSVFPPTVGWSAPIPSIWWVKSMRMRSRGRRAACRC